MDALAYGSRMLMWAPLGKLFLVIVILVVDLFSKSIIVPIAVLVLGLCLMAYSTNFKLPKIVGIMIAESILIIALGAAMVSILPTGVDSPVIWEWHPFGLNFMMTHDSFNYAFLIFLRALAGVTLMIAFSTSTPIPHLANSLRQLRIPADIVEIVILIYRYSFLLLEQLQVKWNAAKSRLGFSTYRRSFHTTAKIMVNVFTSSLEIVDRSSVALGCRNFTGEFPVFRPPKKMGVTWVVVPLAVGVAFYLLGVYTTGWVDMASIIFG